MLELRVLRGSQRVLSLKNCSSGLPDRWKEPLNQQLHFLQHLGLPPSPKPPFTSLWTSQANYSPGNSPQPWLRDGGRAARRAAMRRPEKQPWEDWGYRRYHPTSVCKGYLGPSQAISTQL